MMKSVYESLFEKFGKKR